MGDWAGISNTAAANRAATEGVGSGQRGALAGQDARFNEMREAQLRDAFAQSIGMSGIAGAGKFSRYIASPEGQAAFQAFKQKQLAPAPKPPAAPAGLPSATPPPTPLGSSGNPTAAAPKTPQVSQMGGNLTNSKGLPPGAMSVAPGMAPRRLTRMG
jgi:hypothetical protein